MNCNWIIVAFVHALIAPFSCVSPTIQVVDERTALENQILGSFEELEQDISLLASVRSDDSPESGPALPRFSDIRNQAIQARQTQQFNRDDGIFPIVQQFHLFFELIGRDIILTFYGRCTDTMVEQDGYDNRIRALMDMCGRWHGGNGRGWGDGRCLCNGGSYSFSRKRGYRFSQLRCIFNSRSIASG